jgi:hypothetical protein
MQISSKPAVRLIHSALRDKAAVPIFVFAFVCLCGPQSPVWAQSPLGDGHPSAETDISLVLETSKTTYRISEPVEVLAYLENRSTRSYYVGSVLLGFWGTSELHEIRLRIYDESNKEVSIGRGGGSWLWKVGTTINEKLAQAYTQLRPNTVFGQRESVPITLPPGKYRLTASYREMEALSWPEAERARLPIPVWTKPLVSKVRVIEVLR